MIRIDIMRNAAGDIAGFRMNGHADTAPKGQDIGCAGGSSLAPTALLGLGHYAKKEFALDMVSGYLTMDLKYEPDAITQAILETMTLGLKEISANYPNSVRLTEHRR